MTPMDWAYAAAFFDGEGCVTVNIAERKTATQSCVVGARAMNLSLRVANNDPTVPRWFEKNIGGTVRFHSATRDSYVWIVQGDLARAVAVKLMKYTKMKKRQLRLFVQLMDTRQPNLGRGYTTPDSVWRQREKLISQLRADPYRRRRGESVIS